MSKLRDYGGLVVWIGIVFMVAAFAAWFEPGSWYEMLDKPYWTPPNWLFPIVWPVLYLLMAISAWLVWREFGFDGGREELKWFGIQLFLNALWSWIFFGQHLIGTALGEILLLWVAILFTLLLFWRKSKPAAYLLLPYLVWVSYASALNYAIYQFN